MSYSLGEAAKAIGKAKSTVLRAIKDGRMSAAKGESGAYCIDPAELHRVFSAPVAQPAISNATHHPTEQVEHLQARLETLEREREREREQMQSTIDDLRARLDRSEDRMTGLLADQRPHKTRRRWWHIR